MNGYDMIKDKSNLINNENQNIISGWVFFIK
jgi:hypothetical protein